MIPQSYLVRIYRRDLNHPDRIEGLLVAMDEGPDRPFHSAAELLRLLTAAVGNSKTSPPQAPTSREDSIK